jgi:hypothetical protein
MCFLITLLLLGPRVVLFLWWFVDRARWDLLFDTYLIPVLGIVFLPWTTMAFVFVGLEGITGIEWVWLGLGIAPDLFSYAGSAVGGRGRVGSYY